MLFRSKVVTVLNEATPHNKEVFLTSAPEEGGWSAMHPNHFTPRERTPRTLRIRKWFGWRTGINAPEKKRTSCIYWKPNHDSSIVQRLAYHNTHWIIFISIFSMMSWKFPIICHYLACRSKQTTNSIKYLSLLTFIVTIKCPTKYVPQNNICLTGKYSLLYLLYTFNEMTYTNHDFILILASMWLPASLRRHELLPSLPPHTL
jgi:hypothetical protein